VGSGSDARYAPSPRVLGGFGGAASTSGCRAADHSDVGCGEGASEGDDDDGSDDSDGGGYCGGCDCDDGCGGDSDGSDGDAQGPGDDDGDGEGGEEVGTRGCACPFSDGWASDHACGAGTSVQRRWVPVSCAQPVGTF
jgi:hypothetical protein